MSAQLVFLCSLLVLAGCAIPPKGDTLDESDRCAKNLKEIAYQMRVWDGDGDSYPPSLSALSNTANASLFVCPSHHHLPGSVANIDEWTDYIYISGEHMDDVLLDVAVVICPPENHGGAFGHVLWGGRRCRATSRGASPSADQGAVVHADTWARKLYVL